MISISNKLKKLTGFKQWPPVLIPLVAIIVVTLSPIYCLVYFFIPFIKWGLGFWKCENCKREYGPREGKIEKIKGFGWGEIYTYYICNACEIMKKLNPSEDDTREF